MAAGDADPVAFYSRASAGFGEEVIAIGDEEWDLPTPSEWIVKAVVAHVVVAEAQMPDVIAGRSSRQFDVDVSVLGHDPVSVWRGTAIKAIEAVSRADLDQVVDHPVGQMPLSTVVGFRVTENLVHGWDLARSRGVDRQLDEELATWCLEFWLPMADDLAESGFFAPMLEPADQSPGTRLLALLGRTL